MMRLSAGWNGGTAVAPNETLKLAGLQVTIVVVLNPKLRKRADNIMDSKSISRPGIAAIAAMGAAYARAGKWVDEGWLIGAEGRGGTTHCSGLPSALCGGCS
ncbi:MAG: hypothetical protein K5841_00995 [Fretibacterium sp.]|nr:hypothetical protein [Fretibacterium sp.]